MDAQSCLNGPGVAIGLEVGRRRGGVVGGRVLREERLGEVVPGDRRDDGVHPCVGGAEHEGEGAAVGAAGDTHPGVTGTVEPDIRPRREEVDEDPRVRDLVVGVVEMDPPPGRAEPAGGVGEDDVAAAREVAGPVREVGLAPAEAVREQHRGMRPRRGGREDAPVEGDRTAVRLRPDGNGDRRLGGAVRRRVGGRERPWRTDVQQREDEAHEGGHHEGAAAGCGHERA